MKIAPLFLNILCCLFFSCKETAQITKSTPNFEPKWINKVGAKENTFSSKTYYPNDFGAVNDGVTLSTKSIQKAIDECSKNGGGTVTFKPGKYLIGSLFIKEGVHFNVPENVTLLGSENIADYPEIDTRVAGIEMKWPAALINVLDQKNITLDGEGTIDGQGKVFWDYYWNLRKEYEAKNLRWIVDYDAKRPRTILISNSKNVFLKNLNIQKAGFWTVQVLYSEYVTVDGIKIRNNIGGHGPSTDGVDIDSSRWILVQNCDIDCNDDNFCLKAGRDWDGLRVNKPTEYVVVRNCIARQGAGLFTVGSETSGSIRHVYASNIQGFGTKNGLNIKSATNRGGTVEDVYLENIKMESVGTFITISMNWNPAYSYSKLPEGYTEESLPPHWKKMLNKVEPESKGIPTFKNIYLKNIDIKGAKKAISVSGLKESIVENVHLKNVQITAQTAGSINFSQNWFLDDVSINALDNSTLKIENSTNVDFSKVANR
ncbi:exo-poly-alpha-D-galacturonosidase [Flavobacterium sp. L1I52]|uniref:Exo-poly-alpha-D-galacturonosidase n=1 Tax=Flavobacterium pokkalii TaxID=1940408 RepID=A0ABR7UMY7_9FLAO|nr:glycoside hydrolase family 28 protein [Flavobacterium pokkalii]MBD0724244.1 exo-poly-alpha-D-galacturonosidase [Flavobacterium pokkalii]